MAGLQRRPGFGLDNGAHAPSPSFLKRIDAFRTLPTDVTESSGLGGVMTLIAALACSTLFVCELRAYLVSEHVTNVYMDTSRDSQLPLYLDLLFWDIPCEFLELGVYDTFGADRLIDEKDADLKLETVTRKGNSAEGELEARPYQEEEIAALEADEMDATLSETEKEDLDADWTSTSDIFDHTDFQGVVKSHDMIMVNFYADWCGHCRHFAPTWIKFKEHAESDAIAKTILMEDGATRANFKVLRINCVAFANTCQEQGIQAFPTVRLYSRKGGIEEYPGARDVAAMTKYLVDKAHMLKRAKNIHHHSIFKQGCEVSGTVQLQRGPGVLHFELKPSVRKKEINRALTNVSHVVKRFRFGGLDTDSARQGVDVPKFLKDSVEPLSGQSYVVEHFHQAPKHFLKVVSAYYNPTGRRESNFYTIAHQARISSFKPEETPQAQFHFDVAPIEIRVSRSERHWYDFLTATLAIVGGTYTIMGVLTGLGNMASKKFKNNIGKLG